MASDANLAHSVNYQNGLNVLLARTRQIDSSRNSGGAVVQRGKAQLGASALTLAAIASRGVCPSELPIVRALADHLADQQDADGRFRSVLYLSGKSSSFTSLYYPGQAILALCKASVILNDARYAVVAAKGAFALARAYERLGDADVPADHWFMLGVAELDKLEPSSHLREAVIRVAASMLSNATYDESSGCVYWGDGRLCPAATRAEGLGVATYFCLLARRMPMALTLLSCLERAVKFCLAHQVTDSNRTLLAAPPELCGGFLHSAAKPYIRIDYVQHAVSAIASLIAVRDLVAPDARGR